MWNPIKIAKLTKAMWQKGENQDADDLISAASIARDMNTQMEFPSNIKTLRTFRATPRGRDIMWGRKDKTREFQLNNIIPVITNQKTMETFSPNTVGGHYNHLIKQWSFQELWDKRFEEPEVPTAIQDIRGNLARHVFLAHDFQHIMFRYDTSRLGEACIQAVTSIMIGGHIGPKYLSYVMAARVAWDHKSMEPFKVLREAYKLAKAVDRSFFEINPLEIIELDIEEARNKFNIGIPVEYLKFASKHKEDFRFDQIHPEYSDRAVQEVCL